MAAFPPSGAAGTVRLNEQSLDVGHKQFQNPLGLCPQGAGTGSGRNHQPLVHCQFSSGQHFTWRIALRGEKEVTIWVEGGSVKNIHTHTHPHKREGRGLEDVSQVAMTEKQWRGKQTEAGGRAGGRTGRRCTGLSTLRAGIISSGETGNLGCRNLHKAQ